jgi:hypothetical protein
MTMPMTVDRQEWTELFALQFGRDTRTGEAVLRKVSRGGIAAQRLLHTEVAVGERLTQVAGTSYPVQLCRLVDHDLQAQQPSVTTTVRGVPVDQQPPHDLFALFGDLMVAVQALTKVGVTHGAITTGTVLWDGQHAQLVNLGGTTAIGEPYLPDLPVLWHPPDVDGRLKADPAHDVYQAGMVVYCLATGTGPADAATVRQWCADRAGSPLSALLAGVFAADPADRPDPHELLRRIDRTRPSTTWQTPSHIPHQATGSAPIPTRPTSAARVVPPDAARAVPPDAVRTVPIGPARGVYRQKALAKRRYRERRAQPAQVAWRYGRDLFDVLWYQQASRYVRLALVGVALAVVAAPVVLVVLLFAALGGK